MLAISYFSDFFLVFFVQKDNPGIGWKPFGGSPHLAGSHSVARLNWLEALRGLASFGWKPFGGSPQLAGSHAVARSKSRVRASAWLQMLLGGCEERYGVRDCPSPHHLGSTFFLVRAPLWCKVLDFTNTEQHLLNEMK